MSFVSCYSSAGSTTFNTSNQSLPKSRIKCSRGQITVGDNSFHSASDALMVYLRQYDVSVGKHVGNKDQDSENKGCEHLQLDKYSVNKSYKLLADIDLVIDKDAIHLPHAKDVESLLISQVSSSELHNEVADTVREIKLIHLLKQAELKSQHHAKTKLQQEVEAALLRSAQLLEKVTKEDMSFTSLLNGDINNVTTRTLENDSLSSLDASDIGQKKSGHIYSYRTSNPKRSPHKQSLSNSSHIPVSNHIHQQSRELMRYASKKTILPASCRLPSRGKRSFSSSSASFSNHPDSIDVLKRVRSRSVSPGLKNPADLVPSSRLVEQFDSSVRKCVPSWVGELTPSDVSDSLWMSHQEDRKSYKIPHWVMEVENSKLVKDSNNLYETKPPISPGLFKDKSITNNALDSTSCITTDSRPGLNFSDLVISDTCSLVGNKPVTSSNSVRKRNSSIEKYQPKHYLTIQTSHTGTYSDSLINPQHSRMLDSEFNGEAFLHNNILPQTAKLKKSMENFVTSSENLRHKSLSSNVSISSIDPQLSSLDTLSLLSGKPLLRADVLAATSALGDSTVVSQNYSTSPVISTTKFHNRGSSPTSSGQAQNSLDGLDGDRSWEKMASNFKPPVPVDGEDLSDRNDLSPGKRHGRTLSGRKQPGSMETLKNMLFKLQAEESSAQEGSSKNEESSYSSQKNNFPSYEDIIPALQNYDFKQEPGGQSLEKALLHLNRLKKLVQTTPSSSSNDEALKAALATELS